MRTRFLRFVLVAFVLSSACAHPPEAAPRAPSTGSNDAPRSGSIFFWHVTKKETPGSVYLLGSVHVRGEKASLDRAITDAATECERGAFELDLDAVDPEETKNFIQSEGMLKDKTLEDVVTPETFAAWTRVVEANHLPRATFERFKPWMAALTAQMVMLEKRGIVADRGIDKMLYEFEKQEPSRSRKVVGLETVLEQLRLFQGVSAKVQDLMLRSTASDIERDRVGRLVGLYETGDEAGMSAFLDKSRDDDPETKPFWEAVFDRRNLSMTEKIVPMFEAPGCAVVTVGVGHLLGQRGIVRSLRDRGFEVERVSSRGPTDSAKMAFTVPKPKEFSSRDDGFSVRTTSKPTIRETPVPGMSAKARSYIFANKATTSLALTVIALPDAATASKIGALLEPLATQGLAAEGMKVTGAEAALVGGDKAIRLRGDHGQGDVRAAVSVTWVHGHRLYSVEAKLLSDADRSKLDEQVNTLLESFQHTP